jgi:hypothetical protein
LTARRNPWPENIKHSIQPHTFGPTQMRLEFFAKCVIPIKVKIDAAKMTGELF